MASDGLGKVGKNRMTKKKLSVDFYRQGKFLIVLLEIPKKTCSHYIGEGVWLRKKLYDESLVHWVLSYDLSVVL